MGTPKLMHQLVILSLCAAAMLRGATPHFQGHEATDPKDALITTDSSVIPLVQDGPGTTTKFIVTNLDDKNIFVAVTFFGADGTRLPLPVKGIGTFSTIFGQVVTHASVTFETDGSSGSLVDAWAVVYTTSLAANDAGAVFTTDNVGVTSIIRHDNGDGVITAASQVLSQINEPNWAMPFDHRAGQNTLVTILNPTSKAPANITLLVQDPEGNILRQDQFSIDPLHKQTFTLTDTYPESAGIAGRIAVTADGPLLSAAAFQTDGNGNLISLFPISTALSKAPDGSGPRDILRNAAGERDALVQPTYLLIPEVMDGPATTTQFLITNLDDHPINFVMAFCGSNGQPTKLPIAGAGPQSAVLGTLPVGGSTIVETDGSSQSLTNGCALVITTDRPGTGPGVQAVLDKVGIIALLRHLNADGVTSAASLLLSPLNEPNVDVPFDQTDGSNTLISILNPGNGPASLTIFVYDSKNTQIGRRQLTLASGNRLNFGLVNDFPATSRNIGTVQVVFSGQVLSTVGLQLDGHGNMSTLFPLSTALSNIPGDPR